MSVRIVTLGQVRVLVDGRERSALPQQRLRCALLIHMATEAECSRDTVLSTFWPDRPTSSARHILSQHLYELRRTLGEDAVIGEGDRLRVGPAVRIDARDFERAVQARDFEAAIPLYGGPFLAGFSVPNTNGFETWADRRRAGLERMHRRARRERILALEAGGDIAGALAAAREWADLEPLEDEAQHRLLELLLRSGERVVARARFEQYTRQLRAELDVEPLDETVALFEQEWPAAPVRIAPSRGVGEPVPAVAERGAQPAEPVAAGPQGAPVAAEAVPAVGDGVEPSAQPVTAVGRAAQAAPAAVGAGAGPTAWGRRRKVVAAGIAVAAAVSLFLLVDRSGGEPPVSTLGVPVDERGVDPTRVAVLYFEDDSEDGSLRAMANGLTESLIVELAAVDELSVVSRNGVRPFADKVVPPDSIGRALSVGTILSASLQRSADTLRVAATLMDAASGQTLDASIIKRPVGELFALQDDLAHSVARFLRVRLGREITLRRRWQETDSVAAWVAVREAVTRAEPIWANETSIPGERAPSFRRDLDFADARLERAETIDPAWSEPTLLRGWVALGQAKVADPSDTTVYRAAIARGLEFAGRVLDRTPDDARALELRGTLRYHLARAYSRDPGAAALRRAARADLAAAFEADRTLVSAASTLSRLLQYDGELEDARWYALAALEEDAYLREAPDVHQRLFRIYLDLENLPAAERTCLDGRKDYPDDPRFVECQLAIPAYAADRLISVDSAHTLLRLLDRLDPRRGEPKYRFTYRDVLFARVLFHAGRRADAAEQIRQVRAHVERHANLQPWFDLDDSALYLMTGDTTLALERLRRYVEHFPDQRAYLSSLFLLKGLRSHPRFQQIIAQTPAG